MELKVTTEQEGVVCCVCCENVMLVIQVGLFTLRKGKATRCSGKQLDRKSVFKQLRASTVATRGHHIT